MSCWLSSPTSSASCLAYLTGSIPVTSRKLPAARIARGMSPQRAAMRSAIAKSISRIFIKSSHASERVNSFSNTRHRIPGNEMMFIEVTSKAQPGGGCNGRICLLVATLSKTISTRLSVRTLKYRPLSSSTFLGSASSGPTKARVQTSRASAGSRERSAVPCMATNNCPSG